MWFLPSNRQEGSKTLILFSVNNFLCVRTYSTANSADTACQKIQAICFTYTIICLNHILFLKGLTLKCLSSGCFIRSGELSRCLKSSRKREITRLMCEGPVEPSDTDSGHSSKLKHTTTPTLDFKMMDTVTVNSHKDSGCVALKQQFGRG